MSGEYGIVCNVTATDHVFRMGAKCWIVGGTGGEGWYRFRFRGLSRGGRVITKWAPTKRFDRFRAAWIPNHVRRECYDALYMLYIMGERADMEARAAELQAFRNDLERKMIVEYARVTARQLGVDEDETVDAALHIAYGPGGSQHGRR